MKFPFKVGILGLWTQAISTAIINIVLMVLKNTFLTVLSELIT